MNYEGKSILEQTADPQNAINTADIIILKQEVSELQQEVNSLTTTIETLQNIICDCASLVLTCPVATDTATLRVPISYDWNTFYSTGYNPVASPFDLLPFAAINFQIAPNPTGVYWQRPPSASGDRASFEIDASAAFIPSIDMAVRIGIRVVSSLSQVTPMFVFGYNEQRYRPSAFVESWDARFIVSVPLKNATTNANYVIFQVESLTSVLGGAEFVYGIGENFENQHHLIVKRIQ